jgi:HSP20 family protein
MLPMKSNAIARAIGPITPAIKAHVPALYPAVSRFDLPALNHSAGRHKSTAPAVASSKTPTAPGVSPLTKFFDTDRSDFFKPAFALPSDLMQLSKLLDAERDWFNRHYLDSLNVFKDIENNLPSRFAPGYNITHDEKCVQIAIDLPGVRMDDVSVELTDDESVLHVYGGRKTEVDGRVHELTFDKRFTLGDEIDKENMTANLESGVLTVTAPKVEVEDEAHVDHEKIRKIPLTSFDPKLDG